MRQALEKQGIGACDAASIATTTDPVRLSFLRALLRDAGIDTLVLDAHISAIEGGIGAFPRRLAVRDG